MDDERLQRALGWGSVVSGLLLLAAPGPLARLFGLPAAPRTLRLVGARDVALGLGLALAPWRGPWLLARAVSDALDTAWLTRSVRTGAPGEARRAAVAAGGLGLTLVDVAEVLRGPVFRRPLARA